MDYNLNLMKLLIVGALAMIGSALQFNHENTYCTDKGTRNGCWDRQYCSIYGYCTYLTTNGYHCFGDYECKSNNCVKTDNKGFCQP